MTYKEKKAKATELGLEFAGNIGSDALDELLAGAETPTTESKEPEVKETPKPVVKKAKQRHEMSTGELLALKKADLLRKERVVIIDKQRQYLTDDGIAPSVRISFSLGQKISHAMNVEMNQEPQYVPRGILFVMRDASIDMTEQVAGKHTVDSIREKTTKRYIITPVEGMTDEEITNQRARENSRVK